MTIPPVSNPPSANELLKLAHPTLDGTIAQSLADTEAERFTDDDNQFLKFHGVYQEDDRDLRKTGKKYIMMIRVRAPGGVITPKQYLELDRLSDCYANQTIRITSRQTVQFHGVLKSNLAATIKGINESLLTTLATCGDVVRNITTPSSPTEGAIGAELLAQAHKLSAALSPTTPSYHSIWIDGQQIDLNEGFADPLYGKTYLPRKFKIAFAIPPGNDTDVLTNDVGLIAIIEEGKLVGYNLALGGGMGRSHSNEATFARLGDVLGFITPDQLDQAVRAAVTIHRDFGDRTNRKHARLKYVVAERGVDWVRAELETRAGIRIQAARPFAFTRQGDPFGWQTQPDGKRFLGLFIETGRLQDTETHRTKTALRTIVEKFQPEVRFTAGNNMILANIAPGDVDAITAILNENGVVFPEKISAVRRASTACVALPTCALALAESERAFPGVLTRIESALNAVGLSEQPIIVRITGCPNGCSRPYVAEIGLVGKAPGKYQLYLGGNPAATRLARLWKEVVKDEELLGELQPLFARYAQERLGDEPFGDWAVRALWTEQAS
ncbi:MAG: NADPH-dependent assimilatory sulfite reductase hemoprotein subunit [Verrucomicrobia bacterium]|nr:NADPH-dependent assimilatory sulfite reductase hemoprotein subunit [Verrucomicrobiota bacterium]